MEAVEFSFVILICPNWTHVHGFMISLPMYISERNIHCKFCDNKMYRNRIIAKHSNLMLSLKRMIETHLHCYAFIEYIHLSFGEILPLL
jgi:hypothetical protein